VGDGDPMGQYFTPSGINLPLAELVHQWSAPFRHVTTPVQDPSGLLANSTALVILRQKFVTSRQTAPTKLHARIRQNLARTTSQRLEGRVHRFRSPQARSTRHGSGPTGNRKIVKMRALTERNLQHVEAGGNIHRIDPGSCAAAECCGQDLTG
jgi:hypothetical protein